MRKYEVKDAASMRQMEAARGSLVHHAPWWGTLAMSRLTLVQDFSCETAWTDGIHLGFNPKWTATLNDDFRLTLVAHEIDHVARKHHLRRGGRDPRTWNEAADMIINFFLIKAGFKMIPGALIADAYQASLSTEELYMILWDKKQQSPPPPPPPQGPQGEPQKGGGQGEPQESEPQESEPQESEPQEGEAQEGEAEAEGGESGGESGGQPGDDEADGSGGAGDGEVEAEGEAEAEGGGQPGQSSGEEDEGELRMPKHADGREYNPTEIAEEETEIDIAIWQATLAAQKAGKLPGHVPQLLEDMAPKAADWREQLKEWASDISKSGTSWNPPNRRYVGQGMYLPSLRQPDVGEGWLVMDTSGSVFSVLPEFGAHVAAMCEQFNVRLNILYADYEVQGEPQVIEPGEEVALTARGGGGTDFRPAFAWLAENGITPRWLIYFTDMCGDFPDQDPGFPVLWAKYGDWFTESPEFGRVVNIDEV
jgi:predicted metal-dependent peptidase